MTQNEPNDSEKITSKDAPDILYRLLNRLSLDTLSADWPHDKRGYVKSAIFHIFVEQKVFDALKALCPLNFELDESGESLRVEIGRFQLIIFGEEPDEPENPGVESIPAQET